MRRYWKEHGRNDKKTATAYGVRNTTVGKYKRLEGWEEWADSVDAEKLKTTTAIRSQAEREAQILSIHDIRLRKIAEAMPTLGIEPRSAISEVSTITKDSRLINGQDTERHGVSDAVLRLLGEFRKLSPEERRKAIEDAKQAERDAGLRDS
jgi:hypothetical protein